MYNKMAGSKRAILAFMLVMFVVLQFTATFYSSSASVAGSLSSCELTAANNILDSAKVLRGNLTQRIVCVIKAVALYSHSCTFTEKTSTKFFSCIFSSETQPSSFTNSKVVLRL